MNEIQRTADPIAATFARESANESVAVVDGYGLRIHVERGHLTLDDGIGRSRRTRRYSRAERKLRRVVILGDTGYVSLEAIRWCADLRIAVVHADREARILTVTGDPGIDDPRLRRAQAAAASGAVGTHIARELLVSKLDGQAAVALELLDADGVADTILSLSDELLSCDTLVQCRTLEAQASNVYFGAWATIARCRFAERDRALIPEHWLTFAVRASPLHQGGRSPRSAATPINALLNYGYALAAAECRLAAVALGLDPGLGIVHTDKRDRDSLALDLLEPIRPVVERHILRLLSARHFRRSDFHETRQGACRLLSPLTHELAAWIPAYAEAVAGHAESVAHQLARSSPSQIFLRTPLSRHNTVQAQSPGRRRRNRKPLSDPSIMPSCRTCGVPLADRSRQLCPTCWPVSRRTLALQRTAKGNAALATARATGNDPANTPAAASKRSQALSRRKREESEWQPTAKDSWTPEEYAAEIHPALHAVPLSALQKATGLSISACSKIRTGTLLPHRRHWRPLAALIPQPGDDVNHDALACFDY